MFKDYLDTFGPPTQPYMILNELINIFVYAMDKFYLFAYLFFEKTQTSFPWIPITTNMIITFKP